MRRKDRPVAARKAKQDLQIDTDPSLQRAVWKWQRFAWAIMGAMVLAGFLGLFGDSPLARRTISDPSGRIRVEYDWACRQGAEQTVTFELSAEDNGRAAIWLDHDYIESSGLDWAGTRPARSFAGKDGTTYVFEAATPGQTLRVSCKIVPKSPGRLDAVARLSGGSEVSFRQFIYP